MANNWWREPDNGGDVKAPSSVRARRRAARDAHVAQRVQHAGGAEPNDGWKQVVNEASPPESLWHTLRNLCLLISSDSSPTPPPPASPSPPPTRATTDGAEDPRIDTNEAVGRPDRLLPPSAAATPRRLEAMPAVVSSTRSGFDDGQQSTRQRLSRNVPLDDGGRPVEIAAPRSLSGGQLRSPAAASGSTARAAVRGGHAAGPGAAARPAACSGLVWRSLACAWPPRAEYDGATPSSCAGRVPKLRTTIWSSSGLR
uniref:Uncharacterized protein n=1 Tax=Heliothis virescens TaxID=7102 RepID=A0A2A4K0L5_HELVI